MLNIGRVIAIFFLIISGINSVHAGEKDWTYWQNKLLESISSETQQIEQTPKVKEVRVTATLPDYPWVNVSKYRNRTIEKCITCHDGISNVSASHPPEFGCSVCHGGEPESLDKKQAHSTLIYDADAGTGKRNPSSLSVVEQSCGQLYCHAGHSDENRNHVDRVKKSMMNTMAGVISGLRYQWASQTQKTARYGTLSISDEDGSIPYNRGGLKKLKRLPFFSATTIPESFLKSKRTIAVSQQPSDIILRKQCLQCHLDSPPAKGQYRSQGCAACHFEYSAKGFYEGNDPTISQTETGHARFHKIRTIPNSSTCVQCHRSFILQPLGTNHDKKEKVNAVEDMEITTKRITIPVPVDETMETKIPSLSEEMPLYIGKGQVIKDIHTERGMDCTDCHTQFDIMGDGNLYSKQHEAVEIRCETCHGNSRTYPLVSQVKNSEDSAIRVSKHYKSDPNRVDDWMVVSARNRKMTNVKVLEGRIVTIEKQTGKNHIVPLVKDFSGPHSIPQHQSRLECSACHARWVVSCPSCHQSINFEQSTPSVSNPAHSLDIGEPALMIGPRGKVAPMLAQQERHLTILDEKKNPLQVLGENRRWRYTEWEFTNPHGTSGSNLAYALNPHSTQKQARSCKSCHLSAKALGLGEGEIKIGKNPTGINDFVDPLNRSDIMHKASQFDPQAKVTMRGESLAGMHQQKARAFNQEEINRILSVGNCIPCHESYEDPIYQDIKKSYKFERTQNHRQLRDKILSLGTSSE